MNEFVDTVGFELVWDIQTLTVAYIKVFLRPLSTKLLHFLLNNNSFSHCNKRPLTVVQRRVDIKTRGIVCLEGSVDEGIQASDAHELPVRAYMEAPQRARGQWSARAWPARTAIFDFLSTFYAGSRRGGAPSLGSHTWIALSQLSHNLWQ